MTRQMATRDPLVVPLFFIGEWVTVSTTITNCNLQLWPATWQRALRILYMRTSQLSYGAQQPLQLLEPNVRTATHNTDYCESHGSAVWEVASR